MVQQSTGERWENVGLALSTARPSLAAVLPELGPWYLNVYTPPPVLRAPMYTANAQGSPKMARAMIAGQPLAASAEMALPEAMNEIAEEEAQASYSVAANVATAAVEQTGTALIFRAGRSVDIPSDNSPHKTTIAYDNLPCTFDYVSAPVLDEHVHLRATIHNSSETMFLRGDASIFLSGEYVGTTMVETTAPSETFKVFLGIDDGIKVKRELIERSVDKGSLLQGGIRRTTYAYRLTVHNYAPAARNVVIRDHLPVSQHERVKVKVLSVQPPAKERSKLELLTWEFTMAPDAEQQIEYRFTVEQPQDVRLIGLK